MAAARAGLILRPSAAAPVMGTAVSQSAAMAVASPSFVMALANDFAAIPKVGASLSGFGAMFFSWRMSQLPGLRRDRKRVCDGNHNLVELKKAIAQTRPLARFRSAGPTWRFAPKADRPARARAPSLSCSGFI